MMQPKDFPVYWPRAIVALTQLGVPQEHIDQISYISVADYAPPLKIASPALHAFVKGASTAPLPVSLLHFESKRGREDNCLIIVVQCEPYDEPDEHGFTHNMVHINIYPNRCEVSYGRSLRFNWPYVLSEEEPLHKWLCSYIVTPKMLQVYSRLLDTKPEDLPKPAAKAA